MKSQKRSFLPRWAMALLLCLSLVILQETVLPRQVSAAESRTLMKFYPVFTTDDGLVSVYLEVTYQESNGTVIGARLVRYTLEYGVTDIQIAGPTVLSDNKTVQVMVDYYARGASYGYIMTKTY